MAQRVKNPPVRWETSVGSLGGKGSPGGGFGNPLQYSCLENPHGERSPWGTRKSDMTERPSTHMVNEVLT